MIETINTQLQKEGLFEMGQNFFEFNNKEQITFQTIKDKILELSVDLQKRIITIGDKELSFDVEDHLIDRIIYGLDDVDITLKSKDKIFNFEKYRKETRPWIFINE